MAINSDLARCHFKKATVFVCACNIIAIFCILYALLSPIHLHSNASAYQAARWRRLEDARVREALEARRALEPKELIKRVKEIQEESIKAESQDRFSTNERKKYATELSEKLKQLKGANAKMNQQALEEWRTRKLELKKHEVEKQAKDVLNGTEIYLDKASSSNNSRDD